MTVDKHYSPPEVADLVVAQLGDIGDGSVFDPAIGAGALLDAVARRWPRAMLSGADLDPRAVSRVRRRFPHWLVSVGDALNYRSRQNSYAWREARRRGLDYLVLNPPFSFRGYGGHRIEYRGTTFIATPAMAFLAIALEELKPMKAVAAVLPMGSIWGERDRALLASIRAEWQLEVADELPRGAFPGVAASTVILVARPKAIESPQPSLPVALAKNPGDLCGCIDIIRGRVPVHASNQDPSNGVPWLHTTDLHDGVARVSRNSMLSGRATSGPLVVLPRVGKFYSSKIAPLMLGEVVLSDCVFGLRPLGVPLDILSDDIRAKSEILAKAYVGTGAPHLTIRRLAEFLESIGYTPRHVGAGAVSPVCACFGGLPLELPAAGTALPR